MICLNFSFLLLLLLEARMQLQTVTAPEPAPRRSGGIWPQLDGGCQGNFEEKFVLWGKSSFHEGHSRRDVGASGIL